MDGFIAIEGSLARRARCLRPLLVIFAASLACATPADTTRTTQAPEPSGLHATAVADAVDVVAARASAVARSVAAARLEAARTPAHAAVRAAHRQATRRVAGWLRSPRDLRYDEVLAGADLRDGSTSMGTTGRGHLLGAVQLDAQGDHHSIIERHRPRHTNHTTSEMVDLLEFGAEQVAEHFPGSILRVGNLSYPKGGDIPWSGSHNSGRDADLAFFCRDKHTGQPVVAPDLLEFDAQGVSVERPNLVFDVPRNWALVRALLTHDVQVQWLFISEPLKQSLLSYARSRGEAPALVARAEKVLHQPTDAPPHADHFHLRITCARDDRIAGCLDFGPRWEWVDWNEDALLGRTLALREALDDPDPQVRLDALSYLEDIRAPRAPEVALLFALHEGDDAVRLRALEVANAVPGWSGAAVVAAHHYVLSDRPLDEKALAWRGLRLSLDPLVPVIARQVLDDMTSPASQRALAARSLAHTTDPAMAPVLLHELARQPAEVRAELAMVLRRLTNHSLEHDWASSSPTAREAALQTWQRWWSERRNTPQDIWLQEGFARHGIHSADAWDPRAVDELLALLRDAPDHIGYNTNRALRRITGRWSPLEAWDSERLHRYWSGWWRKNRDRVLADHLQAPR